MRPITQLFLLLLLLLQMITTHAATFTAGKDYTVINPHLLKGTTTLTATQQDKISVVEFFNPGCPWCYKLDHRLEKWLAHQQKNIHFSRIPVNYSTQWRLLARAYYAAVILGKGRKMTRVLFKAIHVDNISLKTPDDIETLFIAHGIKKADFDSAFKFTPKVDIQLTQGDKLMNTYKVYSVPTVIVAGKYQVEFSQAHGKPQQLLLVVDHLIKMVANKPTEKTTKQT